MFVFDKNHKDLFIYEERWIWCFLQVLKLNRRKLKKKTTKNKKAEGELESDYISFASSGEEYDTDTFSYHEHFFLENDQVWKENGKQIRAHERENRECKCL